MSLSIINWEQFLKILMAVLKNLFSWANLVQTDMAAVSDYNKRHPCAPRKKASYTVEAAVILPLFLFISVSFLIFFRVQAIEWAVEVSLEDTAREISLYPAGDSEKQDNSSTLRASAVAIAEAKILTKKAPLKFVRFNALGMDFSKTVVDKRDVDLVVSYAIPMPVSWFGLKQINVTQRAKTHRWVGFDPNEGKGADNSIVYVTEFGEAYHTRLNCTYLNPSIRMVSMASVKDARNEGGGRFTPCPLCAQSGSQTVYITSYGNRYHSNIRCSGLKRTIRATTKIEAEEEGFHGCSKCAK